MRSRSPWIAVLLLGIACGAAASERSVVKELDVSYGDGRFHIKASGWIVGSPEQTFARLTDYEHLDELNDSIQESRRLNEGEGDSDTARVRVVSRGCVLFICRDLRQEQRVETVAPGFVETTFLPGKGDFREGRFTWRLTGEERNGRAGTAVDFDGYLEPAFSLPPAIGPYFTRRQLEREIRTTISRLGELNDPAQ